MMNIAVTAETTIDLTEDLLVKYDIGIVPFTIILGDKDYKDGEPPSKYSNMWKKTKFCPKRRQ